MRMVQHVSSTLVYTYKVLGLGREMRVSMGMNLWMSDKSWAIIITSVAIVPVFS